MSKIDEYKTIKAKNEDAIEKLNWCMGKFAETDSSKFDPQKSKIGFSICSTCYKSEYVIKPIMTYGYTDSSQIFSVIDYKVLKSITDAISMYIPEIIPTAQKLLQAEIDKARCQAADEVKEIMGDLELGKNCECEKSSNEVTDLS